MGESKQTKTKVFLPNAGATLILRYRPVQGIIVSGFEGNFQMFIDTTRQIATCLNSSTIQPDRIDSNNRTHS